jgi:hypothetical protein
MILMRTRGPVTSRSAFTGSSQLHRKSVQTAELAPVLQVPASSKPAPTTMLDLAPQTLRYDSLGCCCWYSP